MLAHLRPVAITKRLALMVLLEALAHPADGAGLVMVLDNGAVDFHRCERLQNLAPADRQLQLVAGQKALDGARRRAPVVPDPMLIAVGAIASTSDSVAGKDITVPFY
jgi:hypothetical protein